MIYKEKQKQVLPVGRRQGSIEGSRAGLYQKIDCKEKEKKNRKSRKLELKPLNLHFGCSQTALCGL